MERLTKKNSCEGHTIYFYGDKFVDGFSAVGVPIQKLGQLEDIEEELGIDLITLFKALKQPSLYVKTDEEIKETYEPQKDNWALKSLSLTENGDFEIFCQISYKGFFTPIHLKLNDYGKTWALTPEELLNDER